MLQLLNQDISSLVEDQLTSELASVLTLTAYIEGYQPQVLEAKKCIVDRASRQD